MSGDMRTLPYRQRHASIFLAFLKKHKTNKDTKYFPKLAFGSDIGKYLVYLSYAS